MKQTAFLSCSVRNWRVIIVMNFELKYIHTHTHLTHLLHPNISDTHPLVSELREGVHNYTKDNVETNGCHNNEERDVIDQPKGIHPKIIRGYQWNKLQKQLHAVSNRTHMQCMQAHTQRHTHTHTLTHQS